MSRLFWFLFVRYSPHQGSYLPGASSGAPPLKRCRRQCLRSQAGWCDGCGALTVGDVGEKALSKALVEMLAGESYFDVVRTQSLLIEQKRFGVEKLTRAAEFDAFKIGERDRT
jgi:hypothetical protein